MKPFRFSLLTLMGVVILFAVAFASLRSASKLWASIILTVTLGLLSVALLGAVFLIERKRAFCAGAAMTGWIYALLTFGPWGFRENVADHLLTAYVIDLVQDQSRRISTIANLGTSVMIVPAHLQTEQTYEFNARDHGFVSF